MSSPLKPTLLILALLLSSCSAILPGETAYPLPAASPLASSGPETLPSPAPTLSPQPAAPTQVPDSGWELLRPGLERRTLNLLDSQGKRQERLTILRLEAERFTLQVHFHPQAQTLSEWQAETGALIVVNGGYFREQGDGYIPTGLTVIDGQPLGSSYGDFAGMLAVRAEGPELRWLAQQPYDPAETLLSALQSFPLLVKPGGTLGFPAQFEDNQPARRTAVARDRAGRFLFITAQQGFFTLHTFSKYLTGSDLELDIALNLDGGPSTGLRLADPRQEVPSVTPLPVVIAVLPK